MVFCQVSGGLGHVCVFWKTSNNHMAQWERECGCLQGAITANTHTCTCMCTHRSSPWEQHHSKTPACEQSKHYSNTHAYVVPFLGSSSLAILFGGETNSSSLKGNLFMPELQWTHTQKHTVTHTNHCLNALNNQLTGYAFYCESAKGCLDSKLLKSNCEKSKRGRP